jgi:CheY-like chemotaxis protein/anti-sigma regulatory factor (Ser/Thr protein kinase)
VTSILVVDDARVDLELARSLLADALSLPVQTARDGLEALDAIDRVHPSIVVTDLQMPKLDGLGLVRAIRERVDSMPVVLMTAHGSEEIAAEALRAGASGYVPKRELANDLATTVQRLLALGATARPADTVVEHLDRVELDYRLPNDSEAATTLARSFLERMAAMRLGDETDRFRVGVALEEAFANAMHHGNLEVSSQLREKGGALYIKAIRERQADPNFASRRVHVHASFSRERATFTVRDEGPGFDPSEIPDPREPENLERVHGRGLLLIQSFMDEVHFNPKGNEIRMVVELQSGGRPSGAVQTA